MMNNSRLSGSRIIKFQRGGTIKYLSQEGSQAKSNMLEGLTDNSIKRILLFVSIFIVGNLFLCSSLGAWEISTHQELTEKAVESVAPTLNAYLIENLGLEGGLNTSFDGMTAKQWMMEGSAREDDLGELPPRPFHHFHEPIPSKKGQS